MTHSKGISWFDDCRIPFVDGGEKPNAYSARKGGFQDVYVGGITNNIQDINTKGRFPANLLVCDDMLNDGIIYSSGSGDGKMEMININDAHHFNFIEKNRKVVKMKGVQYNDKGSNSRYYDIDKWFDKIINYE
jgi:hypothetical protein